MDLSRNVISAVAASHLDPDLRSPECRFKLAQIGRFSAFGERLPSAGLGGIGALEIDLLGPFRRVGEDQNAIIPNFEKPTADRQLNLVAAGLQAQGTGVKRCHQSGVVRKDSQLANRSRSHHHVDVTGKDKPLSGDHIQS